MTSGDLGAWTQNLVLHVAQPRAEVRPRCESDAALLPPLSSVEVAVTIVPTKVKWFGVAFQEAPLSDKPWLVLKYWIEGNCSIQFEEHSRWETRDEAVIDCDAAEDIF